MNRATINTSWLRLGAWGVGVLFAGLLLSSCRFAGTGDRTRASGAGTDFKTLPADCLEVDATGTITAFYSTQAGCARTEFTIPSEKGGTEITAIGRAAFFNTGITDITIPDSVKAIGDGVFQNNALTSLTLGNSVKTIGWNAFDNNQLTSLTIGTSVETIGDGAFQNNQLTELTIPNSVTSIKIRAFVGNPNLKTVILDPNEELSFLPNSFSNGDLLAAYDDQYPKQAGTWTWDGSTWSFSN